MQLSEFKAMFNVTTLEFKKTKTNRLQAYLANDVRVLTSASGFDPKKPAYIYDNLAEGAIKGKAFIISNNTSETVFTV